jgi:hypothetical protein
MRTRLVVLLAIVGLVLTAFMSEKRSAVKSAANFSCSDGWRITGYYTPVETDFASTETREVEIHGPGRETIKETFNAEFLKTVFDDNEGFGEGWGKTRFGWYIGEYNGRWHKADAPLDANDKPLQPDSVAVDNSVIPAGSTVTIPELPGDLGSGLAARPADHLHDHPHRSGRGRHPAARLQTDGPDVTVATDRRDAP